MKRLRLTLTVLMSCAMAWAGPAAADENQPVWKLTSVLLIDKPPASAAFGVSGRQAGVPEEGFRAYIGNWNPRTRITGHASLPLSEGAWQFLTGVHAWIWNADDLRAFGHHLLFVDRPSWHEPDGKEKERVLYMGLSSDTPQPGTELKVAWSWIGVKDLPPMADARLVAFVQQAPVLADEESGWQSLRVQADGEGRGTFRLPDSLRPGAAWLRLGVSDAEAPAPSDRLLAELRLVVPGEVELSARPSPEPPPIVEIGERSAKSRLPAVLQQGTFLPPQSVAALDVADDGQSIAVTTMAFSHDRNFWQLTREGEVVGERYVHPWGPHQVCLLSQTGAFGVGNAYARDTLPNPALSLFGPDKFEEDPLSESSWDAGWLRYGEGDWRTGWMTSLLGDKLVRTHDSIFTVPTTRGNWRFRRDGTLQPSSGSQRPFRMSSSGDGHVLASGFLVPDASQVEQQDRIRLQSFGSALVTVSNSLSGAGLWTAVPMDAPPVELPPEPSGEFPELADDYFMKPHGFVPFRGALSLAVDGDGSRVAVTEFGGWIRLRHVRAVNWEPMGVVSFVPRQRGFLRVFGMNGEEQAQVPLPADGLFAVHLNRQGDKAWCVPMSWFARGLSGAAWRPADDVADTIYVYDLVEGKWAAGWRFPDAVSDAAVHPDGRRLLVSCWDGALYLLQADGSLQAKSDLGSPARLRWSSVGDFAVAGTHSGEVCSIDAAGELLWRHTLAATPPPPANAAQVFPDVPVYSVGRTGPEHAYLGDIWLIKTDEGGILVDTGGTSGIATTWERIKAAGLDPKDVRYVLLSHSHGDHAGAAYLWRTLGAKIVAPQSAAYPVTWMMPTWNAYGLWVPCPIDVPLPLKQPGDEKEFDLCGLQIKAIFVPGHSIDSVVYSMQMNGKRVIFSGDIGFEGVDILNRCWGDEQKAVRAIQVVQEKVLPLQPDYCFTGHTPYRDATAVWKKIVQASREAVGQ